MTDRDKDKDPGSAAARSSSSAHDALSYLSPSEAIEWLVMAETKAGALYATALAGFKDDPAVSRLLEELSADEAAHLDIIISAGRHIEGAAQIPVDLAAIDDSSRLFKEFEKRIASGEVDELQLMEMIVALEFSEHNDLFAYMVNAMRGFPSDFSDLIECMRLHRRRIREHLLSKPCFERLIEKIDSLPTFTNNHNILVVDDEKTITGLLRIVLAGEGFVDEASSAQAALEAAEKKEYSLIVSDVKMPGMDGTELYRACTERHPGLQGRFLFLTGAVDEECAGLFKESGIEYLMKPVSIHRLKEKIAGMLAATCCAFAGR